MPDVAGWPFWAVMVFFIVLNLIAIFKDPLRKYIFTRSESDAEIASLRTTFGQKKELISLNRAGWLDEQLATANNEWAQWAMDLIQKLQHENAELIEHDARLIEVEKRLKEMYAQMDIILNLLQELKS